MVNFQLTLGGGAGFNLRYKLNNVHTSWGIVGVNESQPRERPIHRKY